MRPAALGLLLVLLHAAPVEACSMELRLFFADSSTDFDLRNSLVISEFVRRYFERRERVSEIGCGSLRPGDDYGVLVFAHAQDRARDQCELSSRRGFMVRARLAALGIPPERIAVFAMGDRDLRVPTGRGGTDPQNRFVELVFAPMTNQAGPPTADGLLRVFRERVARRCR
jgi:hypothetical protein